MNEIKIENFVINSSSEPFTIAEAGINHNGNLDTALKMITEAKKAGVCAIKFFTYKTEEFIIDSKLEYTYKFKLIYLLIMISLSSIIYLLITNILGILKFKSYKLK